MSDAEVIDADVVEEQALVPVPQHGTLFRTEDPVEVLERATQAADALKGVIDQKHLYADISGRQHITVEGWLTLGAMLGVTPVCVSSAHVTEPDGWEARVEARTLDGRTIGAAEAMCTRAENKWKTRDDFAIRSMAQTRATSKALGSVLRFVVTLAGYEGTPAEEMDAAAPRDAQRGPAHGPAASDELAKLASSSAVSLVGENAQALLMKVRANADGYLPRIAAQTLVYVQAARQARTQEPADAS